ncbi:hypothetical protein [Pandoravirus japonicus]|uniref:Transmembrane protein n=1 Tax=Pandoravirus japonicus TaxID=2823154 RepID=A0A811BLS3_9VIRU|nr:hypothetical protein [Pandoravirus japonicus]
MAKEKKKEKKRRCESPFATRFGKRSIARRALVWCFFFFSLLAFAIAALALIGWLLFFLSCGWSLFFSTVLSAHFFGSSVAVPFLLLFFWCAFFLPFVAPVRGEICFVLVFLFSERPPSAIPSVGTCVAAHTTAPN